MASSTLCDLPNNWFQGRFEWGFKAALFPTVLLLSSFACFSAAAFGQAPTAGQTAAASGPSPNSAQQPKFDIADVHTSATAPGFVQTFGGVIREGKYINRDVTILNLIEEAYGVSEDNIAGGPGWVGYDLFDVLAKVPADTTPADAKLMVRSLLADRFGLAIREGTSPVPRYVLSVGKGGSKLQSSSGSEASGCKAEQQQGPPSPGGAPPDPASVPNIKVACHNLTAAAIADNLHRMAGGYLDHDVIDETKLDGPWDFNLEWTARAQLTAKGDAGISIFDAVEKQLGLKLEVQNVELPSLVIESVNRKPTANPEGIETTLALSDARFEVAAIKLANPDAPPFQGLLYTGGSQMRAGGTLRFMIAIALQIRPNVAADVVVGLPKSADSQRWDITAKMPSTGEGALNIVNGQQLPPPLSVGLEMLRGLLVDQFGLKTHAENREVTVYALTVEGNKYKMTQATDSERTGCKADPNAPKPFTNIQTMISCKNISMTELAQTLEQQAGAYIDHPIVDATGLQGGWDFLIGWTPKAQLQAPTTANPNQTVGAIPEAPDPSGISVFEAVEKELGLKLVKQQRTIPVIVVDHVSETPIDQ